LSQKSVTYLTCNRSRQQKRCKSCIISKIWQATGWTLCS